jgi:hypothetical protein
MKLSEASIDSTTDLYSKIKHMDISKQEVLHTMDFKQKVLDQINQNDTINTRLYLYDTFSVLDKLALSFKESTEAGGLVNIGELLQWYNAIQSTEVNLTFVNAINTLLDHLQAGIQTIDANNCVGLLVVLYLPILQEPEASLSIMPKICQILANLDTKKRFEIAFLTQESIQYTGKSKQEKAQLFKIIIQLLQQYLTMRMLPMKIIEEAKEIGNDAIEAVQTLSIFGNPNSSKQQLMKLTTSCRIMNSIMKLWRNVWSLRKTIPDGKPTRVSPFAIIHSC